MQIFDGIKKRGLSPARTAVECGSVTHHKGRSLEFRGATNGVLHGDDAIAFGTAVNFTKPSLKPILCPSFGFLDFIERFHFFAFLFCFFAAVTKVQSYYSTRHANPLASLAKTVENK
jgi:hypothetical protein